MILAADGQTRRLSLSVGFFWIVGVALIVALACLAAAAHFWSVLAVDVERLETRLAYAERSAEMADYARAVSLAPEEARIILEQLDLAVMTADGYGDEDLDLVGVPDPEEARSEAAAEGAAPATGDEAARSGALTPHDEVWAAWHGRLPAVPGAQPVDVDEFKISVGGQFSFILRQNGQPGQRVRGRSVTVCAVAAEDGTVTLAASPEFDLTKPEQGWERGMRYNIIASKVVRGRVTVPKGGQVLSAEVLAWDEDDRSLVFRKKIKIEGR
jgi:hypothetical protein